MIENIPQIVRLCFFRAEPKDIAYSQTTLVAIIAIKIVLSIFAYRSSPADLKLSEPQVMALIIFELGVYLSFIFAILSLFNKKNRFIQTATSLLGVSLFFSIIEFIGLYNKQLTAEQFTPFWLIYPWEFVVSSYVLSKALEKSIIFCIFLIFSFDLITFALIQSLLN